MCCLLGDRTHQCNVGPVIPGFFRNLEQRDTARVDRLVKWMSDTRDNFLARTITRNDLGGLCLRIR